MKRISMILSVMAIVFAFTIASVSAQNAPTTKTSTEKVSTEKADKAGCATDTKDAKAGCATKTDAAKSGCATPCSGEKAKACCNKGTAESAKPVPAPDKK
ncbi:MAG: hypothetical protein HGA37_10810 [Lentimicrobium sp.]|nr:hypothetical protein [Lentimicrobium sp.]